MRLRNLVCLFVVLIAPTVTTADVADLEDLALEAGSYWNGSDGSGGFSSGPMYFSNNYNPLWGNWDGFAYSNITDTTAEGWGAQFNVITGSGQGASANYAIGYDPVASGFGTESPTITLNEPKVVEGVYVTNNNFAYYSMLKGDPFSKKFGGPTGDDPDWFLLTVTGMDPVGETTGNVEFYLADFRFENNCQDYIVDDWTQVDLSSLGEVSQLVFTLSSSDTGGWGMNTPAYFALDTVVLKPSGLMLAARHIKNAVNIKHTAQQMINDALREEDKAKETLEALLESGALAEPLSSDAVGAIQKIHSAMQHQRQSKNALRKSINKLHDVLQILTGQAPSPDLPVEQNNNDEVRMADINGDGAVDSVDFVLFTRHWLKSYEDQQ